MSSRRLITMTIANVKSLGHDARTYEGHSEASAAIKRLTTLDQQYGNLMDAIDAADPDAASAILARMIHERQPKGARTA